LIKSYIRGIVLFSIIALFASCGSKESAQAPAGGEAGAPAEKAEKSEQVEQGNPVTAGKEGIFELEGTIGRSNTISNTFILETKEGDVEVQVRAMSKMLVNGERVPLAQVKSGSHAKGTFKKWNGQDAVMEIVITN